MKLKDLALAKVEPLIARLMQDLHNMNKRLLYFGDKCVELDNQCETYKHGRYGTRTAWMEGPNENYLEEVQANPLFDTNEDDDNPELGHGPWTEQNRAGSSWGVTPKLKNEYQSALSQYDVTIDHRRKLVAEIVELTHARSVAHRHFGDDNET